MKKDCGRKPRNRFVDSAPPKRACRKDQH
jgi:hypothetical protein